jgi:uncharacterized protein (TIRG00374 family)
MQKKHIHLLIRAAAGLALLLILLRWVGLRELRDSVKVFHPAWYLAALGLIFLHFFMQSVMLRILIKTRGILIKARDVFRLMVISNFFGVFLPGGIGPDMVLCYNLVKSSDRKEVALSAVIFIRVVILFMMTSIAFLFSFHPVAPGRNMQLLTGAVLLAFLAAYALLAFRGSIRLARDTLAFMERYQVTRILYKAYFVLSDFGRDRKILMEIFPFLLSSAIIKIITDYFIAQSLGLSIPLVYFFVFIPLITVISAIPLTFAGLGVREGSFVGLFALAGVPAAEAVTVSLVSFTLVICTAIIGAILYALRGASLVTRPNEIE